jgi:hypothetical protein
MAASLALSAGDDGRRHERAHYVGKVEHFLVAGREMDVYLGWLAATSSASSPACRRKPATTGIRGNRAGIL